MQTKIDKTGQFLAGACNTTEKEVEKTDCIRKSGFETNN